MARGTSDRVLICEISRSPRGARSSSPIWCSIEHWMVFVHHNPPVSSISCPSREAACTHRPAGCLAGLIPFPFGIPSPRLEASYPLGGHLMEAEWFAQRVRFSLFITRRFTPHRSRTARLVSAAEVTRGGASPCSRAEPHLPLVPLSPQNKAGTMGTMTRKSSGDEQRKPYTWCQITNYVQRNHRVSCDQVQGMGKAESCNSGRRMIVCRLAFRCFRP
jgi:hypothetical protein